MIALGETDPTSAEIPFFLPDNSNLPNGLTGHSFTLGEVKILLPSGGGFTNVPLVQIVERGFGWYVVRLLSAQTLTAGNVFVNAVVSGAQPYNGVEEIGVSGGDILETVGGAVPFFLPSVTDPVFGPPITGHSFATGEVKICLPRASFVNALVGSISEIGLGTYVVALSGVQAVRGKVFVYASVSGAQPYSGFATILNPGGISPSPTPPAPSPVPSPIATNASGYLDHVAAALGRIPMQWRS